MHAYRTHSCGQLRSNHVGSNVKLSGWVFRKRDHGNLLFVDLRDHYGITQVVVNRESQAFKLIEGVKLESVICIEGVVDSRGTDRVNPELSTGEIEVKASSVVLLSEAAEVPFPIFGNTEYPEDIRLRNRFLDLRREKLHANIVLRSQVIASLRRRMIESGFTEFQTPILTASSPEGARDFLVPSRVHHGKFYALPQAPQMFKQLLMVAGFDRYFQIAPCFRDEDARADRSPGEFYQLDFEMSFVTQDDVFAAIEPVLSGVFDEFSRGRSVTAPPFPRITYKDAMLKYGSDKPDLRNPIEIVDVTEIFKDGPFAVFAKSIEAGGVVRAIRAPEAGTKPRSFFDSANQWSKDEGFAGLAYINFKNGDGGGIAKNIGPDRVAQLVAKLGLGPNDGVFFACDKPATAAKLAGLVRMRVGNELGLIEQNAFKFCWIVDFPMYEWDEIEQRVIFSHNPFSMPQGEMEALETKDPLDILAYQYDIVCNGIELSSGAIRNHKPEIMYKAFEIAGYDRSVVDEQFKGMINAFKYGAPPHGGSAPGVDRIVMLLADEPNIREVILFPMNQKAEDLMMGAPSYVSEKQLRELRIAIVGDPHKTS
ncbi:MAG: aspartate--tRNA ligase [Planctomycetaceae bacterium]|jgi:aspartyl-tRNA synthetase|nr:aspartate--tRNA ligase [Planctomycetaceae bacterium]